MSYTHLTKTELIFIEEYHTFGLKGREIARKLQCGRKPIQLPQDEVDYINEKVNEGWTPDVIIGRKERQISCGMKILYRMFAKGTFNQEHLPMKGKRKPNGHQEKRGKQAFRRTISDRNEEHPNYEKEFGHLEGDTIVGHHHKSAVITLVERVSKCIITIKPNGRKARDVERSLNTWFHSLPIHTFKPIIFDCGKEFTNWKSVSNEQDIDIYFADPGTPSQRALNENSNGLLRKSGLPKEMDFNSVTQEYISSISSRRNSIPRKSLNYQTPIECFIKHAGKEALSRLIEQIKWYKMFSK